MTRSRDALHDALLDLESSAPADLPPPRRSGSDRRWAWIGGGIAVAAAALIIGVSFGLSVLRGTGVVDPTTRASEAPTASSPASVKPTPSTQPTASPTPVPPPSGIAVDWTAGDWPEARAVSSVTYDDELGLWIASGGRQVWTSADGSSWSENTVESAGCDDEASSCEWSIAGVVRAADRLVAAGLIASQDSDSTALASWESRDGRVWSLTAAGIPGTSQGASVAESNGTILLTTPDLTSPEGGTAFHVSQDAVTWEGTGAVDGFKIHDVHGDGDGFVGAGVAEGFDPTSGSVVTRPIIRRSNDGLSWTTVSIGLPDAGAFEQIARTATGRYVAAGTTPDGQILVWASNGDGEPWTITRLSAPGSNPSGRPSVNLAAASAGTILTMDRAGGGAAFASLDGETWDAIAVAPGQGDIALTSLGMSGESVVAFGATVDPLTPVDPGAPFALWTGRVVPVP